MVPLTCRVLTLMVVAVCTALACEARAETPAARFAGKPRFDEGKALGYFIWRDGDSWKVRWTTFGAERRFNGRVIVEGGELRDVKRIDVDEERKVIAPGRPARVVRGPRGRVRGVRPGRGAVVATREEDHIVQENEHLLRFNTRTDDDIDGFDFKTVGGKREIRFVLEIDGQPRPAEVEVGRENFKPAEHPIIVHLP
jgi:hypothetical protein